MRIDDDPTILAQLAALADPTRARLLLALARQEWTVGELCQILVLPQSTISRHLKTLTDERWLVARADGPSRRYRMADLDDERRALWALVAEPLRESPTGRQDALRIPAVLAQRRAASTDFFAGAADHWDDTRAELFGQRADLLALLALLGGDWTVGDLGCGTGPVTAAVAPFVRRVLAIDTSAAMLSAARSRLASLSNVELRAGELEALPLADGELDVAVLSLVLHYAADPAAVLAEARRVLLPGGRLLIVDMLPHGRAEYAQTMGHVWLGFQPERLAAWLASAGFAPVTIQPLPVDVAARGPALFVATATAAPARAPRPTMSGRAETVRTGNRVPPAAEDGTNAAPDPHRFTAAERAVVP